MVTESLELSYDEAVRPPESLRWVCWDLDFDALDIDADADAILARVLEHAGLAEVRDVLRLYGEPRILRFFREVGHPLVSERTRTFWRSYFHAEGERWAEPAGSASNNFAPWID